MLSFNRLMRFRDHNGNIHYGEAPRTALTGQDLVGLSIKPYLGNPLECDGLLSFSEEETTVAEVLSPLSETPIIYGIGLNYRRHAEEAGHPIPSFPVVFTKPPDALAGPFEDIPICKEAQFIDYEGELCIVIGKDAKDLLPSANPFDYILGYIIGNDVSSRYWQIPERSGNQHGYAKSFDKFAPIGPVLCSTKAIPDPSALFLTTKVNGEIRQEAKLDYLIFDIPAIIKHLSRGTTLRKGTIIMTGTPSGVAAGMKPPQWLEDGDTVEVEISNIGMIKNKMKFVT